MNRVYDEPSRVDAEDGVVAVDGPDGVAVLMTPDAAEETSHRLLDKATEAQGQQRLREAEEARRRPKAR